MSKQNLQPASRTPTKKQIARSKREQEQLKLVYIGLGVVAALIVIALAIGLVLTYVIQPNEPVAKVNSTPVTTRDYQNRVRYERFMLDDQYEQILQQQSVLTQSGDEQLAQLLQQQYQQLAGQILQQRSVVDRQTVNIIIDDVLIAAEAQTRGITTTEQDVTELINRFLASRQGGLTETSAQATQTARAIASATAAMFTPTPTFTPSPTLTATTNITPTTAPAETPTPFPTPTLNIIAADTLSTDYTAWLGVLADQAGVNEATYRQIIRTLVLRNKVRDALAEETPKTAEQAHARHILVETEEEARQVIDRLEAGADFAGLAAELSKDTGSAATGGDLGFVPRDRFIESVDEAVFSQPVGEIGEPVQSEFGWHVIEVLERGDQELSAYDYQQSQQQALGSWLDKNRPNATIEDFWAAEMAPKDNLAIQ